MAKVPDKDFFYFSINKQLRHNTADHQAAYIMSALAIRQRVITAR